LGRNWEGYWVCVALASLVLGLLVQAAVEAFFEEGVYGRATRRIGVNRHLCVQLLQRYDEDCQDLGGAVPRRLAEDA
jgi:hypothetical protein